jgi:hypothetical protein
MQEYFPCMSLSLTINPQSSLLTISLPFIYLKAYPIPPLIFLSHFNFEFIVYIPPRISDPENVITEWLPEWSLIFPDRPLLFKNKFRAVTKPQFRVPLNVLADPLKPECRIGM